MKLLRKKIITGCEDRGDQGSPYLTRWTIIENRFGAIYLHIFHRSDADEMHDHPWPFTSFILWRGYVEETPVFWTFDHTYRDQVSRRRKRVWPGMILRRPAEWVHRVELVNERPAVTLVVRGAYKREWGFWTAKGWEHFESYFSRRGC